MDQANRIGYGLIYPVRREATDFAAATGSTLIKACARKAINTRAAGMNSGGGEYPWRRNFGSFIDRLRHSNFGGVRGDLSLVYAATAIHKWEPRVRVDTTRSTRTPDPQDRRLLRIRIYYQLDADLGGDVRLTTSETLSEEVIV